jgi:NADH-quinone oxidoreductase subunit A
MHFKAGYYLYAILYLMFDVEAIFLFPWSTVVRTLGLQGLISIVFFILILGLGLAYAWRKDILKWI